MSAINAVVRNGRLETELPLDWPEGTRVVVTPSPEPAEEVDILGDSPESIAAWLEWRKTLEPLEFTPEELAAREADRVARREWEFAHADERLEKLQKGWR